MATKRIDPELVDQVIHILKSSCRSTYELEIITYFSNSLPDVRTFTRNLSKAKLLELAQYYKLETYADSSFVFVKGDSSNKLYILIRGCIELMDFNTDHQLNLLATVNPGKIIGERGLAKNLPRSLLARAKGEVAVMTLDKEKFKSYIQDQVYVNLREKLDFIEKYIPGIRSITSTQKERLSYSLHFTTFSKGEILIEQGGSIQHMHFIIEGECILSKHSQGSKIPILMLSKGSIIGDEIILLNKPSSYTVTVATDTLITYKITKNEVKLLPESTLDILKSFLTSKQKERNNLQNRIESISKDRTESLIYKRFSKAAPGARKLLIRLEEMQRKRDDMRIRRMTRQKVTSCKNILEGLGVNSLASVRRKIYRAGNGITPEPELLYTKSLTTRHSSSPLL
jgi:CRP-like cAMP-binding protein